jgi:glycosyltransferase involved in cell wall biosynthesis
MRAAGGPGPRPGQMRLAVIETAARGGLLHYAAQLADALAERGHEVDLVAPRGHEVLGRPAAARQRPVLAAAIPPDGSAPWPARPPALRRAGVAARLGLAWARILWEARRGGYDAVIVDADVGLWLSAGGAIALTALPGRPKVAVVGHNVRTYNRWSGDGLFVTSRLQLALERRMYERLDLVFVHGDASRAEFERTWPVRRLAVIPHGDERLFAGEPPPPSREERILFFGEWRRVKGLGVLVEAFDLLVARRPTARLTIAGAPAPEDADPDPVRRWAADHGDRVTVIDRYVPIDEVPALFAGARVVVAPYLVAYASGVVAPAMTMGRAVVASGVGDLGAAVADGVTGLLVQPDDPQALSMALERLLADGEEAARMGSAGRARADAACSWEAAARSAEAALTALVGEPRA